MRIFSDYFLDKVLACIENLYRFSDLLDIYVITIGLHGLFIPTPPFLLDEFLTVVLVSHVCALNHMSYPSPDFTDTFKKFKDWSIVFHSQSVLPKYFKIFVTLANLATIAKAAFITFLSVCYHHTANLKDCDSRDGFFIKAEYEFVVGEIIVTSHIFYLF
jgi:hypothetical protein